jgi:hypothetical protein
MPAALPLEMQKRHMTNADKLQKEKNKASVTPKVKLKVPRIIRENLNYYSIWKETMTLYKGTEILNALDAGQLSRYCIEVINLEKLYRMRDEWYDIKKISKVARQNAIMALETRIEQKTKLINQMALSLYMTPRARAGAVPNKPDKEPEDENRDMFD